MNDPLNRISFGKRLKAFRKEQDVTSEKLAEMCDISPTFVRQIESAYKLPSLPMFVRMCNELKVAPNFFLADSLTWNGEEEIAALGDKLRTLSPNQYAAVMAIVNTLIDNISMLGG